MDRWLNLNRKGNDVVDEGSSCTKQNEASFGYFKKCRHHSKEYLSIGFTSTDPEDKQLPQCVLGYDILSNEAMKPSKL